MSDITTRLRQTQGKVFQQQTLTLTDAEREAIEVASVWVNPERHATLRGLLDRTQPDARLAALERLVAIDQSLEEREENQPSFSHKKHDKPP